MGETFARGDFLSKNSTPVMDDTLDLCPGNVGGQIVPAVFGLAVTKSDTSGDCYYGDAAVSNTKFVPAKAGSIVGISVHAKTAVTLGHVTVIAVKGSTDVATAKIDINTTDANYNGTWFNKDLYTFSANKPLGVTFDAAATNTTNAIAVTLFVEM